MYATLAVRVQDIQTPSARRQLARAYLDLGADGLWVKLLGFHGAAAPDSANAGAAFLRELAEGPAPVVGDGAGQLHLGLLASDVSASIGIGESELFRYPSNWKKPAENSKRTGRNRSAYHPVLMRSFRIGGDPAARVFAASRCRCGVHPPAEPPTNAEVGTHAAIVRMRDAKDALDGSPGERREWLMGLATKASWAEHDAEIKPSNAFAVFEAFFAGWDDASMGLAVGS